MEWPSGLLVSPPTPPSPPDGRGAFHSSSSAKEGRSLRRALAASWRAFKEEMAPTPYPQEISSPGGSQTGRKAFLESSLSYVDDGEEVKKEEESLLREKLGLSRSSLSDLEEEWKKVRAGEEEMV